MRSAEEPSRRPRFPSLRPGGDARVHVRGARTRDQVDPSYSRVFGRRRVLRVEGGGSRVATPTTAATARTSSTRSKFYPDAEGDLEARRHITGRDIVELGSSQARMLVGQALM